MDHTPTPATTRGFSSHDVPRVLAVLALLPIVAAATWFSLGFFLSLRLPEEVDGPTGPWVIGPPAAFHFGATAAVTVFSLPVILAPFRRRWASEDAALGSRYEPFIGQPQKKRKLIVRGFVFGTVYVGALLFYPNTWTLVEADKVQLTLPWTVLDFSYDDISTLEVVPDGHYSKSLRQNGPWYAVDFKSGRSITFSLSNEGMTTEKLSKIARHVSRQTGRDWLLRGDAQKR